jgi:hypothetical protein
LFVTFRRLWISQASRTLILLIVVLREKKLIPAYGLMYQQILISEKSISRCGYLNFILTVFVCANIWAQIIGKSIDNVMSHTRAFTNYENKYIFVHMTQHYVKQFVCYIQKVVDFPGFANINFIYSFMYQIQYYWNKRSGLQYEQLLLFQ